MVAGPMPSIWSSWSTDEVPPCCIAELDDLLGGHRPDPLDRVELLDGRGAERDGRVHRPGATRACNNPNRACGPAGHDDLLPVGQPRREVEPLDLGPGGGAAGALHGVVDARPRRQPVDIGLAHGSRDVDDDVLPALRRRRRTSRLRHPEEPDADERLTPAVEPGSSAERIQRAPTSSSVTATAP